MYTHSNFFALVAAIVGSIPALPKLYNIKFGEDSVEGTRLKMYTDL